MTLEVTRMTEVPKIRSHRTQYPMGFQGLPDPCQAPTTWSQVPREE